MGGVLLVSLAVGLLCMGAMVVWADKVNSDAIIRRLVASGARYRLKVGKRTEAWDPSKPTRWGNTYSLAGPGVAEYWLDAELATVHVEWQAAGAVAIHLSGPVPSQSVALLTGKPRRRPLFGSTAVLATYALATLGGAAVGNYRAKAGNRDDVTFFGGLAGFFLAYVCMAIGTAIAATRSREN